VMSTAAAEKARALVQARALEKVGASVAEHPTNPEQPAMPWVCSGDYCAGCSFPDFEGEHPKDCQHHDPLDPAGWAFWKDELPARAVAAIQLAKRHGVPLPKALLERV
jgi:hypothetical protein